MKLIDALPIAEKDQILNFTAKNRKPLEEFSFQVYSKWWAQNKPKVV